MRNIIFLVTLIILILAPVPSRAQEPNQAGLAIQFPDGRVETACVAFSEDEISGVDLLNRSELSVIFAYSGGLGATVCKIDEIGCDISDESCFCQCQGSTCSYWNYWFLQEGQWIYSPLGAGSRRLGDGDVDGWAWGDGQQPPPLLSLEEICPVEVALFTSPLETPTIQPIVTQTPLPTATSPASPLSLPTATAPVSPLPLPTATAPPQTPTTSPPSAKVFIPATSGESPTPQPSKANLPTSPDSYVGFVGVLAALGLIALTVWRRRKGV